MDVGKQTMTDQKWPISWFYLTGNMPSLMISKYSCCIDHVERAEMRTSLLQAPRSTPFFIEKDRPRRPAKGVQGSSQRGQTSWWWLVPTKNLLETMWNGQNGNGYLGDIAYLVHFGCSTFSSGIPGQTQRIRLCCPKNRTQQSFTRKGDIKIHSNTCSIFKNESKTNTWNITKPWNTFHQLVNWQLGSSSHPTWTASSSLKPEKGKLGFGCSRSFWIRVCALINVQVFFSFHLSKLHWQTSFNPTYFHVWLPFQAIATQKKIVRMNLSFWLLHVEHDLITSRFKARRHLTKEANICLKPSEVSHNSQEYWRTYHEIMTHGNGDLQELFI